MPVSPEIRNVHQLIYTKQLCDSEALYVFTFVLQLIEACCLKVEVPQLIVRIAINYLGMMISDSKIVMNKEMKQMAINKLVSLRGEVVFDFVKLMQLDVGEDYFLELARKNLETGKYAEAAVLIIKFKFFNEFNLEDLIF